MPDGLSFTCSLSLLSQVALDNPLVIAAGVGVLLVVGFLLLRRKPSAPVGHGRFDLSAVDVSPPPSGSPVLMYNGIPVRLVAVVMAPLGPGAELPQGHATLDRIVPGLGAVAASHGAQIIPWESHSSVQNFMLGFFGFIQLPGNGGVGTPWCAAAGKVQGLGSLFLAGLLMHAESPNNLEQIRAERPSRWLEFLQVQKT